MNITDKDYNPAEVIALHEAGVREELDERYGRAWFQGRETVLRNAVIQRLSEVISVCGDGSLPDLERRRNRPMTMDARRLLEREIRNIAELVRLARERKQELTNGAPMETGRKLFVVR